MTVKTIVDVLNDAFKTDPRAVDALLCARSPCNQAMVDHPTIMVGSKNKKGDFPVVGILGVLNAIAATEDEIIEAQYDDDSHCMTGFRLRPKTSETEIIINGRRHSVVGSEFSYEQIVGLAGESGTPSVTQGWLGATKKGRAGLIVGPGGIVTLKKGMVFSCVHAENAWSTP